MKSKKSPLESAFHFLSFRSRSEKEMRDYLQKKEFSQIDETIEKLKNLDFINDNKFTQEFIESRSKNKPKGKKALMIELARKGIKIENIEIDEKELATKAISRKSFKSKEQMQRFLYSRGFSWDTIIGIIGSHER
ncbi:MAG: regulatory protein RecX [Patescibacteria group bacterium]